MRKADAGAVPVLLLFAAPLALSLIYALSGLFELSAWSALFAHPQLWSALQLSIFTGLASAVIAAATALFIVAGLYQSRWWAKLSGITGAMQSLPHAALAIGVAFLIMPSGFIARVLALIFGWTVPPPWVTTHDPYGLALIAALSLKEIPFLIWIIVSILNRDDIQRLFAGQRAAAISLGHGMRSIWLRVFLPQLVPKLVWPLVIVFIYASTFVDMALIIGPTQPPTLANVVWVDLNSEQVSSNARGGVGAVFLSAMVAVVALLIRAMVKIVLLRRDWLTAGPWPRDLIHPSGTFSRGEGRSLAFSLNNSPFSLGEGGAKRRMRSLWLLSSLNSIYLLVTATLLILSFAVLWPFPDLLPQTTSASAWLRLWHNPAALMTSVSLAISTVAVSLLLNIAWFETQPVRHDRMMIALSVLALGLPSLLLGLGEYRVFLLLGLTGSAAGLFITHLLPVTAYMFIVLVGPSRSFDPRWQSSAHGLLASFARFFWLVKMPLLKVPLLAASAIGFAVSFGQYVPAQLIAAGRYSTLPMEAVTLTSGSNRPLTAAFALMLMLPPLIVFLAASHFGKSRWATA